MTRRVLHIAEIGLRVKDLPRMVAFYQELLGLEVEKSGPDYVFLKIGEFPSLLGEEHHPQMLVLFDRALEPISALSTLDHLAFEIPYDAYAAELERLQEMGMVIKERAWPDTLDRRARSFFFRDPEENIIELITYDPVPV